jgi:hypothetical protein
MSDLPAIRQVSGFRRAQRVNARIHQAGEPLTVVTGPDGSVTALNTGSFSYTRTPYDPAAPVPGGVDADGWRAGPASHDAG